MKFDYLLVGFGLAGLSFVEHAKIHGKRIAVFNDDSQPSSRVAGGLYNPVVLKRFTPIWKANEQSTYAKTFYKLLENNFSNSFFYELPIYRKFSSVEEQNNWFIAADNPVLSNFLEPNLINKTINFLNSPYGFGLVKESGYLDIVPLLLDSISNLKRNKCYFEESFNFQELRIECDTIFYKNIEAKEIVFAEGFGLHKNPYFNYLPLDGTKGDVLTIKAPKLKLDAIVKSSIFVLPIGNDLFKIGATYDWSDKSNSPSNKGKQELLEKINELISCDFQILEHNAGVRPTVKDRRPLLGRHPLHSNLYVFNGLGTRGVMLAPFLGKMLLEFMIHNIPLDKEVDIVRYNKLFKL